MPVVHAYKKKPAACAQISVYDIDFELCLP